MNAASAALPSLPLRSRRFATALALTCAIAIALIFWTQQRYPSLLKKLHSGTGVQVKGALSFDALLPVTAQMPPAQRIARTAANWIWTNRFGMYFAIPLGAVMMTLLSSSDQRRRFASPGANVLCGAVAGMPLGVCANCATPIGQSLLAAGASTRLSVAAVISSPSFNPVVLTMAFVLFPQPLPWQRILVPAALLCLLPWLVREAPAPAVRAITLPGEEPALYEQASAFFIAFFRNLLRLLALTLPWMLLAALLGAAMAELIPAYATHLPVSIAGIAAVAVLGTLLPAPMAFDVALPYVLYRSGVPLPYVAALLCTMGPVSIYSLTALGRHIGTAASIRIMAVVMGLGFAAGLIAMR